MNIAATRNYTSLSGKICITDLNSMDIKFDQFGSQMLPISAPVEFGMRAIWEMIVSFEYFDLFDALIAHF